MDPTNTNAESSTDTPTDEIVPVHVTRFADPSAVETAWVDGDFEVTNRDELAEIDQVVGMPRSVVEAHGHADDIIEPGDTLWHDRFADLGRGEEIDFDDLDDGDDTEGSPLVTDGGTPLAAQFTPAEQELVTVIAAAVDDAADAGVTEHRIATVLSAAERCVGRDERPLPIHERFRRALGNPGSYLPARIGGGDEQ